MGKQPPRCNRTGSSGTVTNVIGMTGELPTAGQVTAMIDLQREVSENVLHGADGRHGLVLQNLRLCDHRAIDYATYMLIAHAIASAFLLGSERGYGFDLEVVDVAHHYYGGRAI